MAKKETATPRVRKSATGTAQAKASSMRPALSPSDGVRLLRERIEEQTSGRKRDREALAGALSRLEAEYDRILSTAGPVNAVPPFAPVSRQQKRSAPLLQERPQRVSKLAGETSRQEVTFVPTPHDLIDVMLEMADVKKDDVVYDLGCGDGRIVIAAAKRYGARGVGIDKDATRIEEATERAAEEGVAGRVMFLTADLFDSDVHEATVVMLYLLPSMNVELRQRLIDQLKPGARIVSHAFDMGDWQPTHSLEVGGRNVYLWTVSETPPDFSPRETVS
jgi:SAM-dependent methyltransferase